MSVLHTVTIMFHSVQSAVSKLWAMDLRGLECFQGEYEIIGRADIINVSSQHIWLYRAALLYSDILRCCYSDKYSVNWFTVAAKL